jgi:hypothetical protein
MIDAFSFGRMVVDGRTYGQDLILFPDGRIQDSWWRKSGHRLTAADIAALMAARPAVVVVGTGVYGYMKPDDTVGRALAEAGIRLVAEPTGRAWQTYNRLAAGDVRVGACFHVGC